MDSHRPPESKSSAMQFLRVIRFDSLIHERIARASSIFRRITRTANLESSVFTELNHEFHRNKAQPDIEPPDFITSIFQQQIETIEIGYR